jgi:hypothetical protein
MAAFPEPREYVCYRAASPVIVDGRLDEPAWKEAEFSTSFVDIVSGEPAWFDSRVALAWDDQNLYVGYRIEEPDVRASLTERDSLIYTENDVELFIAGENVYYELEMNARNTVYEVFWIWRDRFRPGSPLYGLPDFQERNHRTMRLSGVGGHVHPRGERIGFLDWDFPGLRHAVHVEGTLNRSDDRDKGWEVELALPWNGMKLLAEGRSLPPKPGDVWRIDCSRFQNYGPDGNRLERSAGWTWNRHGYYDSHIPETFTRVRFENR